MKKLLLLTAAVLQSFLAISQEAESAGSYAELTLIPHLELVPEYSLSDRSLGFNPGNSAFYTLFEGQASEHFSWTVANMWLSAVDAKDDFGWQYRSLGRSDMNNMLMYLNGVFTFDNWAFTLGKDCTATGGFEYEDWDWDVRSNFGTPFWNSFAGYQWGGKVAWTSPSEMTNLAFQVATSPLGEHPFSSGLWEYSFQWKGEYGWFSNIWSSTAVGYDKGAYDWIIALGNRATFDDWTITLDYNNTCGVADAFSRMLKGTQLAGTVNYAPSEKMDFSLKGIWSEIGWSAGAMAYFYPLRDSQDLRLHAAACYDNINDCVNLNIGLRYNIAIHLW